MINYPQTHHNSQLTQPCFPVFWQNTLHNYLEEQQEKPKLLRELRTVVVVPLDNFGGLIQAVLVEFLLG